jgi:cellulose biosynthesis protein BcsQ
MLVLGVVGTKGGTGKTTVAANLAAVYADMGYRVLMVDTDPRPSLSSYFQIKHRAALKGQSRCRQFQTIRTSGWSGCDERN